MCKSVGCIFAELILREPLLPGQNFCEQLSFIFEILGTPFKHELNWITSMDAKNYILNLGHEKGHDLRKICKNASAQEIDLIKNMLIINPNKRYNINDALSYPYFVKLHIQKKEKIINAKEFYKQMEKVQSIENDYNSIFGVRHLMYQTLTKAKPLKKANSYRLIQTDRCEKSKKLYKIAPDSC